MGGARGCIASGTDRSGHIFSIYELHLIDLITLIYFSITRFAQVSFLCNLPVIPPLSVSSKLYEEAPVLPLQQNETFKNEQRGEYEP